MDPLLLSLSALLQRNLTSRAFEGLSIYPSILPLITAHVSSRPRSPLLLKQRQLWWIFHVGTLPQLHCVEQGERHAMTPDRPTHTPASARRQPFFLVCLRDTPTPFFCFLPHLSLFPSVTDISSLTADLFTVSLNVSFIAELLLIHLISAQMPTYGYKSVFAQIATFRVLNDMITHF